MNPNAQQRLMIVLGAVLLAVILVSGIIIVVLPNTSPTQIDQESDPAATATPATFDLTVFERAPFKALNNALLQNGLLPVQPPPATGKANPFL